MKKITALLLAVLIAAAVGCTGGNGGNNNGPVPAKAEPGKYTDYAEVGGFRLNALAFSGTRTGTETGVNGRSGKDGLRFVFELGEWIDFRLDYEYGSEPGKLGLWIFPHRENLLDNGDFYENGTDAFFCEYELPYETYPDPLEDGFSLEPDEAKAGDYDLIFTVNDKLIGFTMLRFYDEGGLAGLTAAQIEELMAGE